MFGRLSLRFRIALVIFVLEACMLAGVLGVALSQSRQTAHEFNAASQKASLDLLSTLSVSTLLTSEHSDFQLYIQDVRKQPSLQRIVLADRQGRVVAGSQVTDVGRAFDDVVVRAQGGWQIQPVDTPAGVLGTLAVQFSDAALTAAHRRTRNLALGVALAGMLLIAAVGLAAGAALTRRLERVTVAARRFADGDPAARSQVAGHDEVALLSQSFDRMAQAVGEQRLQLKQQGQYIELLLDSTAEAIYGTDADGVCTFANPACVRMLRLGSAADLVGRPMHELIHHTHADGRPNPKAQCKCCLAALQGQAAHAADEVHWRADGTSFPVEFWSHPLLRDGRLIGAVTTFIDITERKQAQTQLLQFKTTLDLTQDCVFMFDPRTLRFFYVNQGATDMVGYSADELMRMTPVDIKPDYDAAAFRALIAPMFAGGPASLSFEARHRHKDGHDIEVEIRLQYVAPKGEPPRFVAIVRNIVQRKQAERALRRMNEELELRVLQRTAELLGARDEAVRANRSKSEFLSRMSHELRTPLNAILGFGQLIELDGNQPSKPGYVREILRAGRHLLELIDEVLDLARIESGKLVISLEPIALPPLIEECLTLLRPQAQARGVRLLEVARGCDVHVLADRTRLKQVLLNLLSNAVKYNCAQGSVSVGCVTDGQAIRIGVSDTGAGLTPEQQARLFVPFERLGADTNKIQGTGIGLALSKRLVELMGGVIGVDSTPDAGSTFWVRLSLAAAGPARAPAALLSSQIALLPTLLGPLAQRVDVLCIEDNPANLHLIEMIFEHRADLRLLSATAPGLGLELARAHRPALILLDISLPDMDGYEVMRCLRENALTRHIPVVAISANAMAEDIERGKAAGFYDYMTKPLDVNRLVQVVDKILAEAGAQP